MTGKAAETQPVVGALPPPIFVLGTRGPGIALVGAMIGRNPAAFGLPQINLFVGETLERMLEATPSPNHVQGLLRALAYIYGSEQTIISVGMAWRWVFSHMSWPTSQVFDELRRRVAPQRLVDKSVSYSRDAKVLERIRNALPDAYYIHIVEHPLTPGAIGSTQRPAFMNGTRRPMGGESSGEDQMQWLSAHRLIAEAMHFVEAEKYIHLQLDKLLSNPHAEMRDLCRRLALPDDDEALAEMLHPERSPFACLGPVGANLGDDPAFLQDPTFPPKAILSGQTIGSRLTAEVAQFAAQYGYE